MVDTNNNEAWPALPFENFKSTQYLLHMLVQAIGKLKLSTPFEPHWANVALWLTSRGLTSGLIPYRDGCFTIEIDLIDHHVVGHTTWGAREQFDLSSSSVATLIEKLFAALEKMQVKMTINPKPQEIENPILFHKDKTKHDYDAPLANAWWRILISSYRVMQAYHARFAGISPSIGLMWGTFDLRDVRYLHKSIPTTGINASYIRRNAMDFPQVEAGWWSGSAAYPRAAYFSFMYPQPNEIESVIIEPKKAYWNKTLGEFILDYDEVRKAINPEKELLTFLQSSYQIEAEKAHWDTSLITAGEPV